MGLLDGPGRRKSGERVASHASDGSRHYRSCLGSRRNRSFIGDKMKSFIVVRMKKNGTSIHKVWVDSKAAALELCWSDDSGLIGKFIANRLLLSPSLES